MKRMDLFKNVRRGTREYHRVRPAWHAKSVSAWLLTLLQINTASLIQGNWDWQGRGHYFYKLLSIAVLCMDDNGVSLPGRYSPVERFTSPEDTSIDDVLLAIDRGCTKWVGKSATDLIVMINYHLNRAIESQPTNGNLAFTLEEIRDVASLATLGLEITKLNGDSDAEAN